MFVLISILACFVFFQRLHLRSTVGYLGHKQKFAFSFKQFFSEQQTAVAYHKIHPSFSVDELCLVGLLHASDRELSGHT